MNGVGKNMKETDYLMKKERSELLIAWRIYLLDWKQ